MNILFDKYKNLVITSQNPLYQRENLVDVLRFYIPSSYNNISTADFTWTMEYVDPNNIVRAEILDQVVDETGATILYNDSHYVYTVPVTSKLSQYVGTFTITLTGVWIDPNTLIPTNKVDEDGNTVMTNPQYVLHSGKLDITIAEYGDYFAAADDSLNSLDKKLILLQQQIQKLNELHDTINASIPTDLAIDENSRVYLIVNGKTTGEGVEVLSSMVDYDGDTSDGIIDLDNIDNDVEEQTSIPQIPAIIDL